MRSLFCVFGCLATLAAVPAGAATQAFTGTSFNINTPAAPSAACPAPLLDLRFGPDNTGGTSNFGTFSYTQAHCAVGGPGAYGGGVFQYLFDAGDSLSGTYSGVLSPSGTMGLLNNTISYVVTGGTGRFAGASGLIDGTGTLDFRSGVARADLNLAGNLNLAAVPEPSSWALMIGGLGLTGAAMRRRTSQKALPGGFV
jgi:hypothetical protein